jgi:sugar lactone lactonase YvrE
VYSGRFWAGTLGFHADGKHTTGQLWVYDPSTGATLLVDDRDLTVCFITQFFYTVANFALQDSNGLGWSKDLKTLYFTNSMIKQIYAYDYNVDTGEATNRRSHVDEDTLGLEKKVYGNPDGLCIDKDGYIWSARLAH